MFKIAKEKQPDKPDDYLVVTEAGTMNGIYDGDTWRNNRGEEITPYAWVEYWGGAELL